jgi:DNA modification methylase
MVGSAAPDREHETTHRVVTGDAREMDLPPESVELVVTSPPYPMIEMWDDLFVDLAPDAGEALAEGDGDAAFEAMHNALDSVWERVERALVPGGIACINVGDATRKVDGRFRVYPNHARIIESFAALGFDPLPDVLWRKPANSAAKFMGSGTVPPNAYVTLEHEYVLVFRKGARRSFEPGAPRRYESAFFWEERNRWFSDVWTEVRGRLQDLAEDDLRDRAAAYPFEIPYRLINMYSVRGDTVLDPFWGTGTTTLAAMAAARNSVGVELDGEFADRFRDRASAVPAISRDVVSERLAAHREFVATRRAENDPPGYEATHFDFPVVTAQEQDIRPYVAEEVFETEEGYRVTHAPADAVDPSE